MLPPPRQGRSGFTLIELILAVGITMLILLLAVPSLRGAFAQKRLDEAFQRFDELVREAQKNAVTEGKPYEIAWEEEAVVLRQCGTDTVLKALEYDKQAGVLELRLPFAVKPSNRWTFWSSGTCEPAEVDYDGEEGHWKAVYDPLTTMGEITESVTK